MHASQYIAAIVAIIHAVNYHLISYIVNHCFFELAIYHIYACMHAVLTIG